MTRETLEQEREKLNRISLDDPRILEQSRKVDRLLLKEMRKKKPGRTSDPIGIA